MSSSGCHIVKRLRVLIGASLLLGSSAFAAEETHHFVFTAYSNVRGGASLLEGDYDTAMRVLGDGTAAVSLNPAATSNNRCIALAVSRRWDAARVACDAAVHQAQRERDALPAYEMWARTNEDMFLAVALSNRAVLNWLSADPIAAQKDLTKAQMLAPNAAFVTSNRTALQRSLAASAELVNRPGPVVLQQP